MTEEYKYKPPLKYLFVGLGGIILSIFFGLAIGKGEIWFTIIMILFCLMTLAMGIGFLTIFFKRFGTDNLKIGNDFIEIPGRWNNRIKLQFEDVIEMGEFDTYDNVIEIKSKQGVYLIERNWMTQKDFDNLKRKLRVYWTNK